MQNTQVKVTTRSIAKAAILSSIHLLETDGAKAVRKQAMEQIKAERPEVKDVGAAFNDAKHILVNAGTIPAFGRHGTGKNHHSSPRAEQAPVELERPADAKWAVEDKDTGTVVAYAASRAKAYAARTDADAQRVVKL